MYSSQYRHENSNGFYADRYTYLVMKLERWEVAIGIRRKAGPKLEWELVNHDDVQFWQRSQVASLPAIRQAKNIYWCERLMNLKAETIPGTFWAVSVVGRTMLGHGWRVGRGM